MSPLLCWLLGGLSPEALGAVWKAGWPPSLLVATAEEGKSRRNFSSHADQDLECVLGGDSHDK